jgi:TolB-like protein/DNA-binding winged helix-turn-helix (wHTH) protein/Flp pilus assembly protein TadD
VATPAKPIIVTFGPYEFNPRFGELRKEGMRVRLEGQPLAILQSLLDRPGELVTREELRKKLWREDTFVDFERSLNAAVKRLRAALNDSPDQPRYIETLARRGYRFIAPVNTAGTVGAVVSSVTPNLPFARLPSAVRGRRLRLIAMAVCGIVVLTWGWRQWRHRTAAPAAPVIHSLAVLPLENLSGDPSQEYLADGMTEELIGRLSGIQDLRVTSRTSVMGFKDTKRSVPEIAKMLGVDAIVEGSVVRDGNRIRVHAQLIRAASDEHFWSEEYDRDLKDVLALQSDLAQAIANRVEVSVTGKERARLVAARPVSPEAYDSNLKGRFIIDYRVNNRADIEEGIRYFQDAIARDPSFAQPYVGLGDAYSFLSSTMLGGNPLEMHTNEMRAAQKALELDPDLVGAHLLYADVRQKQYQWAEAEAEFKRAIELGPNSPQAHFDYALFLALQGRADEAIAQAQRAGELNPPVVVAGRGTLLFLVHRYDEALTSYRDLLALGTDEGEALWGIGTVLLAKHQAEQAVPVLEKAVSFSHRSPGVVGGLVMAYAQSGRRRDALRLLAELQKGEQPGYSGAFVIAYLGLGDYDKAFAWLERAYQEQANIIQFLKVHPFFDPVRGDPRFQDLRRRVGLN